MLGFVRSPRYKSAWLALAVVGTGCNWVLGINEPEEVTSPNVRYYPWDGATDDGGDAADGPVDSFDVAIAPDAPRADAPPGTPDARPEGGPTCSNVPTPGAASCGFGCAILCPLGRVCLKDSDCSSGRCFGARCTLPTCTNGMKDGQESDVDCGGLCPTCGTGRGCRLNTDCTSRTCTNGLCQPLPVDASADARDANVVSDGNVPRDGDVLADTNTLDASGSDSDVDAEADAGPTSDGGRDPDAMDGDIRCEAGCPLCTCPDGG